FCVVEGEDGIRDDMVTGVQTCALPIFGAVVGSECLGDGDRAVGLLVGFQYRDEKTGQGNAGGIKHVGIFGACAALTAEADVAAAERKSVGEGEWGEPGCR